MAELSYKDQQDLKNIEKIREHLQILPRFCGEYFRSLEIRKSTNTRKNYAYDLGVFFYFLKTNNPYFKDKDIHTLPIEVLDMITAMDVEEYLILNLIQRMANCIQTVRKARRENFHH